MPIATAVASEARRCEPDVRSRGDEARQQLVAGQQRRVVRAGEREQPERPHRVLVPLGADPLEQFGLIQAAEQRGGEQLGALVPARRRRVLGRCQHLGEPVEAQLVDDPAEPCDVGGPADEVDGVQRGALADRRCPLLADLLVDRPGVVLRVRVDPPDCGLEAGPVQVALDHAGPLRARTRRIRRPVGGDAGGGQRRGQLFGSVAPGQAGGCGPAGTGSFPGCRSSCTRG